MPDDNLVAEAHELPQPVFRVEEEHVHHAVQQKHSRCVRLIRHRLNVDSVFRCMGSGCDMDNQFASFLMRVPPHQAIWPGISSERLERLS